MTKVKRDLRVLGAQRLECFDSTAWNRYYSNINSAFASLREENDFADVTLACEDGQQIEAHKVILASSSPFFQNLLKKNKHPHPLIYLKGVKHEILLAVVDILYFGEANVFQDNLDSFLIIAEELQLKGLMGKTDERVDDAEKYPPSQKLHTVNAEAKTHKTNFKKETSNNKIVTAEDSSAVAIPSSYSGDVDQLEEMVKSMMEKSENNYPNQNIKADRCKVCGKEGKGNAIKDHIEANHIEGIVLPCNFCEKTFRSRNALRHHNRHKC